MDRSREDIMIYKAKCKNGEGWQEGYYWKTEDILPETLCRYTEKTEISISL